MEGLLLCCARRLCSSAWLNRNRVVSRAFSSQQVPIIDQVGVGVLGSLMKEAEGSKNWELFKSWMVKNERNYESEKETLYRYKICETKKKVDKWNKEETSGRTFGLTCFADMTRRERSRYIG